MDRTETLVQQLDQLVSELDEIVYGTATAKAGATVNDRLTFWNRRVIEWLRDNVGSNAVGEFMNKGLRARTYNAEGRAEIWSTYLHTLRLEIINHPESYNRPIVPPMRQAARHDDHLGHVGQLLRRFPAVVSALQNRHDNRPPMAISDEYDVQYLLNALLRTRFDDVRAEEVSPSYAGGSSRMDFLLKAEQIVVEVKLATAKLRDSKIGEQLLVDIARYQKHSDCRTLVCFIYDPNHLLKNPAGLITDLGRPHGELLVSVVIAP